MGVSVTVKPCPALSRALRLGWLAAAILALGPLAARADDAPPPINPTGRTIEMVVPLNYRSFYLGDLPVRLTPQQEVEVARDDLLRSVKELLRSEALKALGAAGGNGARVTLSALRANGFDFRFDPGAVSVIFSPTLDQKVEGNISVEARRGAQTDSPNAAKPAAFSAYLNLRSAVDYVEQSPVGNEGLKAPRLDLEGAARWKSIVVEAEATFEPDDASVFGDTGEGFKRRGTRIVRDFEEEAVRASAGDVYPVGTSFQYTPDLLGISIERSYSKLQPGRNIRSTSRRSFRLERTSTVEVQVNGLTVRRLRLDPGDYNLSDLPISTGLNDVTLLIEDDVGHTQRLDFSLFQDNDLIDPGLAEWAFSAGVPSQFENGEPAYDTSDLFATGYYRRGLTENLTGEAHLQGNMETAMGGFGALLGTPAGLFSVEGAASFDKDGGWGAAFSGDYSLANIKDAAGRRHSIRLSASAQTPDFSRPAPKFGGSGDIGRKVDPEWLDLSAGYGTELPFQISAFLSAGYGFGRDAQGDSYHADLSFSRPLGHEVSLGLSGGIYETQCGGDDLSMMLRLQYRPDRDSSLAAVYDSRNQRSSLSYNRQSGQGVGSWQTSIDVAQDGPAATNGAWTTEDDAIVNGAIHYTGNRANVSLFQDASLAGANASDIDQRTSLRLETAIAYADGHVAVGRPVSDSFAIIAPYAGLADKEISIGKEAYGYTAETDFLGPALLPSISPYTLNRVEFDVADLPPGYDLGDGLFDLVPEHRSGYALQVGSQYTVTALGTLKDAEEKPLALLTGTATEEAKPDKTVELFTNRAGRFTAQGLAPGKWTIEMATEPKTRFSLVIPKDTVGLYRAGELRPL